jgi:hypothetical protein
MSLLVTDLAGSIYSAHLNGSEKRAIASARGNLSGIAYAEKLLHRRHPFDRCKS